MKKILIAGISKFDISKAQDEKNLRSYTSDGITVTAYQTNEACAKFLLKKLGHIDEYIRVQSLEVQNGETMSYLDESLEKFCDENFLTLPNNREAKLREEDEAAHSYERVLKEIAQMILSSTGESGSETEIYLDMSGGKRDNYVFVQLLTKLLGFYGYKMHAYYTDFDGTIVNTDLLFTHMEMLDAVNEFVKFGSSTSLRNCFKDAESPTVKALLCLMEDLSDSVRLCKTDLPEKLKVINQQLDGLKNVEKNNNGLFMIKTMEPLIREKFNIPTDDSANAKLKLIQWCLDNELIQQALTIYNENAIDIVMSNKFIEVDMKNIIDDVNKRMKGQHISKRSGTILRVILLKAFEEMDNAPQKGTKEMQDAMRRYHNFGRDNENTKQAMASMFFGGEFIPEDVTINIDEDLFRNILSDICYATAARNQVNHASDDPTYDKFYMSLFCLKSYPFSSYPDKFTPKYIKKDLSRAAVNLEKALNYGEEISQKGN